LIEDLPLFSATLPPSRRDSEVEKRLAQIVADELSPREALDLIYELKSLLVGRTT
jgi:DNA mismatch repair protein MutS